MSLKSADYSYKIGLRLVKEGKLEIALIHFNKALEILPYYAEVLSDKGAVLTRLARYDEALETLNKALKIKPNLTNALNNKNFVLKKLGKPTISILKFPLPDILLNEVMKDEEEIKKKHQDNIEKMQILYDEEYGKDPNKLYGTAFVGPVNLLSVEELKFLKRQGVNPENNNDIIMTAVELLQKYDFEKALKLYDIAIKINDSDANAWYGKGNALGELKRFENALDCYDRALEIIPNAPSAYTNKGLILIRMGRFEKALQCIEKAIELDPKNAISWSDKANALNNLQRHEEAKKAALNAIKINSKLWGAWVDKGMAELYLERYDEASVSIDTALELNPKDSRALAFKENIKIFKEVSKDIKKYEEIIAKNPKDVKNIIDKGISYLKIGKTNEALNCLDKALEIDNKSVEAWSQKGNILTSKANYEEALKCIDKALEIDPKNSEYLSTKAYIFTKQENLEEAVKYTKQALKINPSNKAAQELNTLFVNYQKYLKTSKSEE